MTTILGSCVSFVQCVPWVEISLERRCYLAGLLDMREKRDIHFLQKSAVVLRWFMRNRAGRAFPLVESL